MVFDQNKTRLGILVCFLVGLSSLVKGQDKTIAIRADTAFVQQVGFTDLSNIKEVLNYRLPSWGYSVFSVGGNLNGNVINSLFAIEGSDEKTYPDFTSIFELEPYFKSYQESEIEVSNVEFSFNVNGDIRKETLTNQISDYYTRYRIENQVITFNSIFNLYKIQYASSEVDEFSGWGLLIDNQLESTYRHTKIESFEYSSKYLLQRNEFNTNLNYIIGKGRLRNVTPIFSALRFLERGKYMGKSISNDRITIQKIAQQFAKQDAYTANVLSRPNKYFWDDLIREAGIENQLSAFEINYLQETSIELMGERFQGSRYEFQPGVFLNRIDYNHNQNQQYVNPIYLNMLGYGLYTNVLIKTSNNPSLNYQHQTSTGLRVSYLKLMNLESKNTSNSFNYSLINSSLFTNLLADRWVWNNGYDVMLGLSKQNDLYEYVGNLKITSDLAYFFESNTSMSIKLNYTFDYNKEDYSFYDYLIVRGFNYVFSIKHFFSSTIR